MIDEKAIEAAYAAFRATPKSKPLDEAISAAIAAADKVRAERFNFEAEAAAFLDDVDILSPSESAVGLLADGLRCAFAVGLAKGDADRAALNAALHQIADVRSANVANDIARAALALVRKGE